MSFGGDPSKWRFVFNEHKFQLLIMIMIDSNADDIIVIINRTHLVVQVDMMHTQQPNSKQNDFSSV